ncbi:uncharacterized protein K452DRAFT_357123 [Aplosporella prunicola CBS 121167]|uniref:C3H1-type domain-containing protein n=1 Tax=Aplosporella prunicola CBS 121167 TaxID=1176127 RepID=A0A6A6BLR9_9PEZI|nr:uncharacterized protein K452DRAFT_357123 [Aplosporella prunicola CBS 121167]KAF2144224.1 hypothetical protein K452DRAFT_357123 [Aplosporella prunicola CBS 121167]
MHAYNRPVDSYRPSGGQGCGERECSGLPSCQCDSKRGRSMPHHSRVWNSPGTSDDMGRATRRSSPHEFYNSRRDNRSMSPHRYSHQEEEERDGSHYRVRSPAGRMPGFSVDSNSQYSYAGVPTGSRHNFRSNGHRPRVLLRQAHYPLVERPVHSSTLSDNPAIPITEREDRQPKHNSSESIEVEEDQTTPTNNSGPPTAPKALRVSPTHTSAPRTKPKDFNTPLTCYFWATKGRCRLPDAKCSYAHYHTGFMASAPVRIGQSTVAGTRAQIAMRDLDPPQLGEVVDRRERAPRLR